MSRGGVEEVAPERTVLGRQVPGGAGGGHAEPRSDAAREEGGVHFYGLSHNVP